VKAEGEDREMVKKKKEDNKPIWAFNVNTENEQIILASLWKSAAMRKRILGEVEEDDFNAPRHKIIFNAISQMEEEELVYNEDTLAQIIKLEEVGGYRYVEEILDAYDVNANIDWHVAKLKDDSLKNDLFNAEGQAFMEVLTSHNSGREEILSVTNSILNKTGTEYGMKGVVGGEELLNEYLEDFEGRDELHFVGTGLKELDERLTEGFAPAQVSVLSARPSVGKTVLMANIVGEMAKQKNVLVCEIETGNISLLDIMVSLKTGVPLTTIVKYPDQLEDDQKNVIRNRIKMILNNPQLKFFDDPALTLARLELELRSNNHDVCFIDLFTRLLDVGTDNKSISEALKRIKIIARLTNTHICLIHQIRRKSPREKEKRPSLDKLKDSGTFEEVADLVLGLHRERMLNKQLEKDVLEIIVMKQKRGESNFTVPYEFLGDNCEVGAYVEDWIEDVETGEDDW
jgi:replicative DNA helicase